MILVLAIAGAIAWAVLAFGQASEEQPWRTVCVGQVRDFAGQASEVEVRVR